MARSVCIVSCCEEKRPEPTWAENLYVSESFFLSRRFAEAQFDAWMVFSAKHGLLNPGDVVAPYDQHISNLSEQARKELVSKLATAQTRDTTFTSLCVPEYNRVLEMAKITSTAAPTSTMAKSAKHAALKNITDPSNSESYLDDVYTIIERVIRARGLAAFREAIRADMPNAGIYLFFDPREPRLRDVNRLRVVRIGTHGVSNGSKASLRDRMRTHFGTTGGGGNHRSSIFRLHVGQSLIQRGDAKDVRTWGSTTQPSDPSDVHSEAVLEALVSDYIGNLQVALLDVPGASEKSNDRAYLEQNLIALMSNNFRPLDPPSHQWLGRYSDRMEVRKSGLWNVNHTGQNYDPRFRNMLDYYASLTLGQAVGVKPNAPHDWIASVRSDARQLKLFPES